MAASFQIDAPFSPSGDQPQAIERVVEGVRAGLREQVLMGVTGSGKTNVMGWALQELGRPVLVLSPNKTLAAQLAAEFRRLFPKNAVEYFVSYYDYYQPEAYVPSQDLYIEKDSSINEEIDRLRHSATAALLGRRDVVVVASVSCIYGLGSPESFFGMLQFFERGATVTENNGRMFITLKARGRHRRAIRCHLLVADALDSFTFESVKRSDCTTSGYSWRPGELPL